MKYGQLLDAVHDMATAGTEELERESTVRGILLTKALGRMNEQQRKDFAVEVMVDLMDQDGSIGPMLTEEGQVDALESFAKVLRE